MKAVYSNKRHGTNEFLLDRNPKKEFNSNVLSTDKRIINTMISRRHILYNKPQYAFLSEKYQ